jgi:hypothetical protein
MIGSRRGVAKGEVSPGGRERGEMGALGESEGRTAEGDGVENSEAIVVRTNCF